MKIRKHTHVVTVEIVDAISIGVREAAFLRKMAKHCIETDMQGHAACKRLVALLDAANVPAYDEGPVYGLFEDGRG